MAHVLRRLKINEVSSVDRAANGHARIVLYKRDDAGDSNQRSPSAQHLREMAELISQSEGVSVEDALHFLLFDRRGVALSQGHKKRAATKRFEMLSRSEMLKSLMRSHGGLYGLAEHMAKSGDAGLMSEAEFTHLVTQEALQRYPDAASASQAFTKLFLSPASETLRKAHHVVVQVSGGRDDSADLSTSFDKPSSWRTQARQPVYYDDADEEDDNGDDALEELEEKAKALQKRDGGLSYAQAFSKVYTAPENSGLVARERAQNGFVFPRPARR